MSTAVLGHKPTEVHDLNVFDAVELLEILPFEVGNRDEEVSSAHYISVLSKTCL